MDVSLVETLTQELRRGTLTLCVLGALKEPLYGYLLQQRLADARTRCIRCCGVWRNRICSRAAGISKNPAPEGIIVSTGWENRR